MSNGVNPASPVQPTADPMRAALSDFVTWSQDAPAWQRDALRRLYSQWKLAPGDLDELFIFCRQPHNLLAASETAPTPQPLDASHVPATLNTGGPVSLKSLGHTQNVNALADDQTLRFAETGLTIVYGDNGSGKSGYGRVLKRACRARDQEDILPNAYATASGKASARIKYSVGGAVQPEVVWQEGIAANPRLSSISVFDSKCASVHVDGKNELAYTPVPLQLLQALADTCRDFGTRLKTKKTALETQVPAFRKKPASREGTAVHQILANLSATTELAAINSLAQVSDHEKARLEQLKRDLATDPVKEVRKLKTQKQRIEELATMVAKSDAVLLPATADGLRDLLQAAKDKATAAQLAANQAFNREPLPQAGSEVWKTLWEAARAFSTQEAYPAKPFPNTDTGAVCVLCQQALSPEAATRMKAFEKFVQERVQQVAADAKLAVQTRKDEIKKSCVSDESLREIVRLLRDDLDQPLVCRDAIHNLARARVRGRRLIAATDPALLGQQRMVNPVASKLGPLVVSLDERITELQKTADPEQRKLQENELRGLEDRVWLASVLADVEAELGRLKTIAAFGQAIDDTDTNRITRKTTEVSRALVTDTIRDAFAADVAALNIADPRLELTQEASGYGSTKFKVSLIRNPNAKVARVPASQNSRLVNRRTAVLDRLAGVFVQVLSSEGADFLKVLLPRSLQFVNLFRHLGGEVQGFTAVARQIVEFPRSVRPLRHQLPISHPDGAIAFMQPPEIFMRHGAVFAKDGNEAAARRRRNRLAVPGVGFPATCEFHERGSEIDEMAGIHPQFTVRLDSRGPMHNQWCRDAAFMHPGLVKS